MIKFFGVKYFVIFNVIVMSGGYQLVLPRLFIAIKANTTCMTSVC